MEKRSNRKVSYSNSLTHSSLLWDFASSSTLIFSISALISLPLPKDSLSFFHPKKNKQHYLPRMLPACDLDKVAVQEPFVSSQCSLHRTSHDCCTRLFTALGLCINHCTFQALNGVSMWHSLGLRPMAWPPGNKKEGISFLNPEWDSGNNCPTRSRSPPHLTPISIRIKSGCLWDRHTHTIHTPEITRFKHGKTFFLCHINNVWRNSLLLWSSGLPVPSLLPYLAFHHSPTWLLTLQTSFLLSSLDDGRDTMEETIQKDVTMYF